MSWRSDYFHVFLWCYHRNNYVKYRVTEIIFRRLPKKTIKLCKENSFPAEWKLEDFRLWEERNERRKLWTIKKELQNLTSVVVDGVVCHNYLYWQIEHQA